jgi:hypothetical protein
MPQMFLIQKTRVFSLYLTSMVNILAGKSKDGPLFNQHSRAKVMENCVLIFSIRKIRKWSPRDTVISQLENRFLYSTLYSGDKEREGKYVCVRMKILCWGIIIWDFPQRALKHISIKLSLTLEFRMTTSNYTKRTWMANAAFNRRQREPKREKDVS